MKIAIKWADQNIAGQLRLGCKECRSTQDLVEMCAARDFGLNEFLNREFMDLVHLAEVRPCPSQGNAGSGAYPNKERGLVQPWVSDL